MTKNATHISQSPCTQHRTGMQTANDRQHTHIMKRNQNSWQTEYNTTESYTDWMQAVTTQTLLVHHALRIQKRHMFSTVSLQFIRGKWLCGCVARTRTTRSIMQTTVRITWFCITRPLILSQVTETELDYIGNVLYYNNQQPAAIHTI